MALKKKQHEKIYIPGILSKRVLLYNDVNISLPNHH